MKKAPFWILVGMLAVNALAGPFTIDKFEGEDKGDPDTYIAAEFNNQLKKANPNQIQDGRFYVRQKFEDPFGEDASTYQIYEGRATANKTKLGKFTLEGASYSDLIKAKYFLNRNASGDDDIERVYFDGKAVFVEGEDPIFASIGGKMQELKPAMEREYPVSLTSQPSGAEVKVAGTRKGTTPLDFTVSSTRPVLATVSKSGYYTAFKILTARAGTTLKEGVLLDPKKDLENPINPLRAKLLEAKNKNDGKALATLKQTVSDKLADYPSSSAAQIDEILAKFPTNPARASEETPDEYSSRTQAWETERNSEKTRLEGAAQSYQAALEDLLKEIGEAQNGQSFSLKYIYVPNSAISFGRMGVKDFELSIDHSTSEASVSYTSAKIGYGDLSKAELLENRGNVQAVVKLWNVPEDNGKFATFHEVAVFYNEDLLPTLTAGTYTSSDAGSNTQSKASEFERKLATLPNRAEWVSKDEAATIAALSQTSSSNTAVAASEDDDADTAVYDAEADKAEMQNTLQSAEDDDYAVGDADVTDRFGNTDEYIRYAAWGLAASALATGVVGIMEHSKYNDAKKAYDNTDSRINDVKQNIANSCKTSSPSSVEACTQAAIYYASQPSADGLNTDRPLYILNQWQKTNKTTMDSYNSSRILWLSLSAASIAGSVVLVTW